MKTRILAIIGIVLASVVIGSVYAVSIQIQCEDLLGDTHYPRPLTFWNCLDYLQKVDNSSPKSSDVEPEPMFEEEKIQQENQDGPADISSANNQFAMNFYSQLSKCNKNIFFSPWSISTAFAIVNEGARGSTSEQFNNVFGFSKDPLQRQNEFKLANDNLNQPNKEYVLSVANALWLATDFTAKPEYVHVAQTYYDSEVESVDFKTDGTDVINSWVENKT